MLACQLHSGWSCENFFSHSLYQQCSSSRRRRLKRRFPSAFALANRHRRAPTTCHANPARAMSGSTATGIRRDRTTDGTTATGHGHRLRAPTGSRPITTVDSISPVGGKAGTATSPTTITGITTNIGMNITVLIATITTTTSSGMPSDFDSSRLHLGAPGNHLPRLRRRLTQSVPGTNSRSARSCSPGQHCLDSKELPAPQ